MSLGLPTASGLPDTSYYGPNLSPELLAQSRVGAIYAAVITVSLVCTVAVALRFVCRRMMTRGGLWWDDWTILAALLVEWSLSAILFHAAADLNFGRHVKLMQPWQLVPFSRTLIATQLLYYCAQTLIKISILLMYHRLFSFRMFNVNRSFRIALYIAAALAIMWFLASFLDTLFQCTPIEASWNHSIQGAKCQNIESAALGTGIANMILDILFIALPLPMIWELQMSKKDKISVTCIFLLGLFVGATSIVRVHEIVKTNWSKSDLTWDSFGINIWSTVESCCSITAACLTTMRPLITRAKRISSQNRTTTQGHPGSKGSKDNSLGTVTDAAINPVSPPAHFWNPPPPSRSSTRKPPYASLDEDDNLEAGPDTYPLETMEAVLTKDMYQTPPQHRDDSQRAWYPERDLQQERTNAPFTLPEQTKRGML